MNDTQAIVVIHPSLFEDLIENSLETLLCCKKAKSVDLWAYQVPCKPVQVRLFFSNAELRDGGELVASFDLLPLKPKIMLYISRSCQNPSIGAIFLDLSVERFNVCDQTEWKLVQKKRDRCFLLDENLETSYVFTKTSFRLSHLV